MASSISALSAAQISQLTVNVGFSTVVQGKTYSADVTYSDGEYIASDGSLSGAVAAGNSVQSAEDNLISRIDALA